MSRVDNYGEFDSSKKSCDCDEKNKYVCVLFLQHCRKEKMLMHMFMNVVSKIKIQNYVHTFLTGYLRCKTCWNFGYVTIELNKNGQPMIQEGKYTHLSVLVINKQIVNLNISLNEMKNFADEVVDQNPKLTKKNFWSKNFNAREFPDLFFDRVLKWEEEDRKKFFTTN